MGFKTAGFPKFGFNPIGFKQMASNAQAVKAAGGVLYLDARKADGSGKLTGNEQWFQDLSGVTKDYTLDNEVVDGNVSTSLTSDDSSTFIDLNPDGTWIFLNAYSAINQNFNITTGDEIFMYTKLKDDSIGRIKQQRLVFSDATGISGSVVEDSIELYDVVTSPKTLSANFKVLESTIGLMEREYQILINMTTVGLNGISKEEMLSFVQEYFATKDIKRANNGTLNNFAGSGTSGWQDLPPVLRFDGVDDFVAFADTASLDIINAPLAIGVTFKVPVDNTGFVCAKNLNALANVQYGILHSGTRLVNFYKNSVLYAGFTVDSANYVNVVFYWDGVNVTSYENGIQKNQVALGGTLTSSGIYRIGKDASGIILACDICTQTIYTGSDINKILKAEAKISAQYLTLNP